MRPWRSAACELRPKLGAVPTSAQRRLRIDANAGTALRAFAHAALAEMRRITPSAYPPGRAKTAASEPEMRGSMAKPRTRKSFDVKVFLTTVEGGTRVSNYRKNRKIFAQGDVADAVFYVQEGQVKLSVISELGKEAVVALHRQEDFFGEGCLNGQPLRLATATTITDCVITRLDKATVVRMLHQEPKFSEMFLSYILTRNARVEEDLVDQLFNSSEKRLARLLLLMANFGKEGRPETVIAKVSQETLAEMVGTTRSRVSHFMNKFRKLGFVEYNGDLKVHNSLLNVILHDNPGLRR
jgi:CRP/FNR family transcriptional regulator, cyclic AMP receptor protein